MQAPSASINDKEVEDLNTRDVTHPAPTLDDDDEEPTMITPTKKALTLQPKTQTLHIVSKPHSSAPSPLVNYLSSGIPPSLRNMPPKKQVQFSLLPAAEISSMPKLPNTAREIRTVKIERLRAELAALQADPGCDSHDDDNFQGYECFDVSMSNQHGAAGSDRLPKIVLRRSKQDGLFEFKKQPVPIPKTNPGVPRVSPITFYQGIVVPPSARGVKGKARAYSGPTVENAHIALHSPSLPSHPQIDTYMQERYLTEGAAGPSRARYL